MPIAILLVEDNEDILANLYAFLEPLGYELDCARNGKTGLSMALEQHFDCIVLDVMLPGLDGINLCRALREKHQRHTPVIMIKASDTSGLVRITEVSPCDVVFTLPESQVPLVVQALRAHEDDVDRQPLPVQAWDREQKTQLGVGGLLSLDNQIDLSTGTVKLKARFPNSDGALYPNQFVNARLQVRVLQNAVTVPTSAVQLGTRGAYVYVVAKNDKGQEAVTVRPITPGIATDALTVATKGIEPGELVVVDGLDRLRDGIAVKVAATTETPKAQLAE